MTYEELKKKMLFHRIVEWDEDHITLDNGMKLTIEMTDCDCCTSAEGSFNNVVLDACITDVSDIEYSPWEDEDTYGCSALINVFHNRNKICEINADADAGNGGYYYSVASLIVHLPNETIHKIDFVCSDDR